MRLAMPSRAAVTGALRATSAKVSSFARGTRAISAAVLR